MQEIHLDVLKILLLLRSSTPLLVHFGQVMHSIKHFKYTRGQPLNSEQQLPPQSLCTSIGNQATAQASRHRQGLGGLHFGRSNENVCKVIVPEQISERTFHLRLK